MPSSSLAGGTPGALPARYHEVRGDALYAKKELRRAPTAEYKRGARATSDARRGWPPADLKIADLGSPRPRSPAVDTEKAKP